MTATDENELAERYGLGSLVYRVDEADRPDPIAKAHGLAAIDEGLAAICKSLALPPTGLGNCWREDKPWPQQPRVKVVLWALRRHSEDGNYAPACGTINLFGTVSSLFHEFGHAIDFQLTGDNPPWSHGQTWVNALARAPQFCANVLPGSKPQGRVRLTDLYLATPHEMFARVFECLITDRTNAGFKDGPDCSSPKLYPQGEERDMLCNVIEHDVTAILRTGNYAQTPNAST